MNKFIRLDIKGTWKGVDHQSRTSGWFYEEDDMFLEDGVSCYYANVEGVRDLYDYSQENMSLSYDDYKNMNVTIFEGEYSGKGADGEELAWCTRTVKQIEAFEWVQKVEKAIEMSDIDDDGEYYDSKKNDYFKGLTHEEYEKELLNSIE